MQPSYADNVTEAIEVLGYVYDRFVDPLAALLPKCMAGEHPHAVARALRRDGTQIPPEAKRTLGLRANAFMSEEALAMMTDKGRQNPLCAIESTLLRATFRAIRFANIQRVRDLPQELGQPVAARLRGVFPDCEGCKHLDLRISDPDKIDAAFPIPGCNRDACAVTVEIEVDFLRGVT